MSKINDGGPAQPTFNYRREGSLSWQVEASGGFSKLEAYALAAMQGILASSSKAVSVYDKDNAAEVSEASFDIAAAMIAEHERRIKESS